MDLTKYYELKQPQGSRYLVDSLAGLGPTNVVGSKREDLVAPPASCCAPVLATSAARRSKSPLVPVPAEEHSGILMTHHFLDAAPPKTAAISGLEEQHLEELHMERWAEGGIEGSDHLGEQLKPNALAGHVTRRTLAGFEPLLPPQRPRFFV